MRYFTPSPQTVASRNRWGANRQWGGGNGHVDKLSAGCVDNLASLQFHENQDVDGFEKQSVDGGEVTSPHSSGVISEESRLVLT
jgi:hypothetical protein